MSNPLPEIIPYVFPFRDAFAEAPGGRYKRNSERSGEHFREDVLVPLLTLYPKIEIDIEDCARFHCDFEDEAFVKAVRLYGPDVSARVCIVSDQQNRHFTRRGVTYTMVAAARINEAMKNAVNWLHVFNGECDTERIKCRGNLSAGRR